MQAWVQAEALLSFLSRSCERAADWAGRSSSVLIRDFHSLNSLQAIFPPGAVIQDVYMQGGAFTMGGSAAPGAAAGAAAGPAATPTAAEAQAGGSGAGTGAQVNVDVGMGQPPECVQG